MLQLSPEKRIEWAKKASDGMDKEERSVLGKQNSSFMHTPEAKEKSRKARGTVRARKNNSEAHKKYWENLSPEEKEQKRERMRIVRSFKK